MAFQQGLSGLNAASRNLDVIGNNIANANTVGMKASRAEFAELYAKSLNGASNNNAGLGVTVGAVTQMFTQGNITITGNELDVAINGNGFYELTNPDGSLSYTRAGQFKLDRDGNVVNNLGSQLMGYPTDSGGQPAELRVCAAGAAHRRADPGPAHRADHRRIQPRRARARSRHRFASHAAGHLRHLAGGL